MIDWEEKEPGEGRVILRPGCLAAMHKRGILAGQALADGEASISG